MKKKDLDALVSYVIFLSIRGETELLTFKDAEDAKSGRFSSEKLKSSEKLAKEQKRAPIYSMLVYKARKEIVPVWETSELSPIQIKSAYDIAKYDTVEKMMKSVKRGLAKYNQDCAKCHFDFGRQAKYRFDDWGTLTRPANLTTGVYRGGRRPIDLFWRVYAGINGSGMTGFGVDSYTDDDIWDVVNFLRTLPYPAMREKYGLRID